MNGDQDRVICRTPTTGRQSTRILKWKYDLVRDAIMQVIPAGSEGVLFKDLPGLVESVLSPQQRADLGDISWYSTCVKLDMEVEGDLERVPGVTPQRLRRSR